MRAGTGEGGGGSRLATASRAAGRNPISLAGLAQERIHFGQFGCYGLNELLLPTLRSEDLEGLAGKFQHRLTSSYIAWEHSLLCCLVLVQKGEQSAHLRRGVLRLSACLESTKGSRSAYVNTRARWIM